MSKLYNGYSNYATWRVNTEILNDLYFAEPQTADSLKKLVEWYVYGDETDTSLKGCYARAFLGNVNYYELERLINDKILQLNENN